MPRRKQPTKPKVTAEAQDRIRLFVNAVQALQRLHGIEIDAWTEGRLSLRDTRRKGNWGGWGNYDAFAKAGLRKLEIETFEGWMP